PANRIPLPPASRIPYSPHSCFPLSIRQSFRYISLYENQGRIAWPSSRPITEDFMSTPWFQTLFAERIGGVNYGLGAEIYKFEKIKRAKRAVLAAHPERQLLDFGIGENDDMADPLVREVGKRAIDKLENRGYADNGTTSYKEAAARFMKKVFGVALDPASEINHAIG